jgi:FAD/FMN-containing dehydrogenase
VPDEAIDILIERASRATSPFSQIILGLLGGAVADVAEHATALGGRTAPWMYHCYGVWEDLDDAPHIAWVRETENALVPYATGRVSINFVSAAGHERVRRAFGGDGYRRLVALKDHFDPDNVFRLNQNVRPSTLGG